MRQPLISIIVPVFNVERYLEATLISILEQSYKHLEVICVNDGSTDLSSQILENFKSNLQIIHQKNKGAAASRNAGLAHARGDFIKFWDADDLMNKEYLEAQYLAIKDFPNHVASCKWGRFYNNDLSTFKLNPESVWQDLSSLDWVTKALSQKNDMASSWLWLIPRSIMNKTGPWNEELSLNDDFEFSMRLLSRSKGVKFASNAIAYYRSGNSGSLASSTSYQRFKDALKSTDLGVTTILQMKNSEDIKILCANRYQEWVYRMYPYHKDLVKYAQQHITELGGSTKTMEGGAVFQILRKSVGWKIAKRIQLKMYALGYHPQNKSR